MKLIEPTELNAFHTVLRRFNLSADDFVLTQTDTTDAKTDEILAQTGFVVVTQTSTHLKGQYPIGDGSTWVSEFERDLTENLFGNLAAPA
jgi:hypothetical protein